MSGPALRPRVARLENGRYRAEVAIADSWGRQSIFAGGITATEDAALEIARRLVEAATTVEPVEMEVPAA